MREFFGRLFTLRAYQTPIERERGRMQYAVTLFILAFAFIYLPLGAFVLQDPVFAVDGQVTTFAILWTTVTVVLGLITLFSTRRGWAFAALGAILLYYVVNILPQFPSGLGSSAPFVFLVLLGGLLYGLYGGLAMMFVAVFTIIGYILLQPTLFAAYPPYDPLSLGYQSFDLLIALAFVYVFLRLASAREQQGQLSAAQSRLQLAQITTTIAGRLNRGSLSGLLTGAVDLIRDSYPDMYHVQIFLLDDERRTANVRQHRRGRPIAARPRSCPRCRHSERDRTGVRLRYAAGRPRRRTRQYPPSQRTAARNCRRRRVPAARG